MSGEIIIRTSWDTRGVKELMRELTPPRLNQALSAAVNISAEQVERKAESLVTKAISLPSKRVKKGIWVRPKSNAATLTAVVRGSGSLIPLKVFSAKEKGGGVTAKIWGASTFYPGGFIYGGPKGGHNKPLGMGDHVFKRSGASRFPIERIPGASIADAMSQEAVMAANESFGVERLEANVLRQLKRYAFKRSK